MELYATRTFKQMDGNKLFNKIVIEYIRFIYAFGATGLAYDSFLAIAN